MLYLGTAFLHHHSDGMLIPSASSACATAGWMMISGLFAGMGISALQPHLASIFQVFEEVFPPGGKIDYIFHYFLKTFLDILCMNYMTTFELTTLLFSYLFFLSFYFAFSFFYFYLAAPRSLGVDYDVKKKTKGRTNRPQHELEAICAAATSLSHLMRSWPMMDVERPDLMVRHRHCPLSCPLLLLFSLRPLTFLFPSSSLPLFPSSSLPFHRFVLLPASLISSLPSILPMLPSKL